MHSKRSPLNYQRLKNIGGSTSRRELLSLHERETTSDLISLNSSSCIESNKSLELINTGHIKRPLYYQHSHAHTHALNHHSYHHLGNSSDNSNGSTGIMSSSTGKRGRKHYNWGTRERTGMSFLIVIAFFAVFGMIILTELFMIDERSHSTMMRLRNGNGYSGRMSDSIPDYENVKDDYDLLDGSILGDNKLGFVQFRDNKFKIQEADGNDGRLAGVLLNSGGINGYGMGAGGLGLGMGIGGGFNVPQIPWGKVLPTKTEETLPPYPAGILPRSGSWQVVNGTRFKFFVFSAYYDRRDGAKLVRVIGATKTRGPERVWCRFWYLNQNASSKGTGVGGDGAGSGHRERSRFVSSTVMARVKIIRENWNLKYSACFVLCPVRGPELDVPYHVSIVSRLRAPPGNLLTLRNTDWDPDFVMANNGNQSARNASSAAFMSTLLPSSLPTGDRIPNKIAVCVKPLHHNYDQALYLIEYLEFYTLLGVSHFTFYNHTLGPHASCVLQHYVDGDVPDVLTARDVEANSNAVNSIYSKGAKASTKNNPTDDMSPDQNKSATPAAHPTTTKRTTNPQNYVKPTINILPWDLRMRSQKEIRTEGIFAALNDCLYRNMYRYKYLVLVDLDEFIVPRHNDTLNDLISSLNRRFPNRNIGAYSFQNAFFYLQFPDDSLVFQDPATGTGTATGNSINSRTRAALVTQRKTKRRFKLHPQKQRSKYICKPEAVVEAGNHFVWEFSPGKGSLNVNPMEAILQHYRVCEFGGNDCIKAPSIVDRTATRYVNRLVQRVGTVYDYLKHSCELPELPQLPKILTKHSDKDENVNNLKRKMQYQTSSQQKQKETQINDAEQQQQQQHSNSIVKEKSRNSSTTTTTTTTTTTSVKKRENLAINTANRHHSTSKSKVSATTTKSNEILTKNNNEKSVPITPAAPATPENSTIRKSYAKKLVVFEEDENGVKHARLQYE